MGDERLWTTAEIAASLRVSRQAVTGWIRSGQLRAFSIQVGSRPVYRVRDRDYRDFVRRFVRPSA